jgi:signal transduction histidine kinase/DNA-binding response OmpR family regulator
MTTGNSIPSPGESSEAKASAPLSDSAELSASTANQIPLHLPADRPSRETAMAERLALLQTKNIELMRALEAKAELVAHIAHDLRQPLTSIVGLTDLLLLPQGEPLDEGRRRYLTSVADATQQVLHMLNNLTDFSRVEAGRLQLQPEICQVTTLLQETLAPFQSQAQAERLTLALEIATPLGEVVVDRVRLQQVLQSLIAFAMQSTPPGGMVTVAARQVLSTVEIAVQDTGAVLPPGALAALFEPYTTSSPKTGRRRDTGLGLVIAKHLIEMHGGRIWAESAEGRGCTITLQLSGAMPTDAAPSSSADSRPLVLVIEDDMVAAEILRAHLLAGGYRLAIAASGHAGLGAAKRLQPQVITLDLGLPDIDGWEVLWRLKKEPATQSIPVVIVSARERGQLGLSLGAVDWLVKPVDPARLLGALRRCQALGAPRRPSRILVVDDEPTVLEALEALLTREGHSVLCAAGGEAALEKAQAERPDIILLDLHLPDLSGFEVVTRLRQLPGLEEVPVIAFSGKLVSPEERALLTQQTVQFVGKYGAATIAQMLGDLRRISALAN